MRQDRRMDLFPFGLLAGVTLALAALSLRDRRWRTR